MFRSKIAAVAVAAAIALTPLSANAQRGPAPIVIGGGSTAGISFFAGCAVSIFITAAIAGHERNRELTMWEALTCGLLYYLDPDQGGDNKNKKKKKKK
jgi:hypothetical protein